MKENPVQDKDEQFLNFVMAEVEGHPQPLIKKTINIYGFAHIFQLIDEAHPCYAQKYLKDKPVRNMKDEQFLKLVMAEEEQMLTITLTMDDNTDNPNIQTYFEEIRQLYYRVSGATT